MQLLVSIAVVISLCGIEKGNAQGQALSLFAPLQRGSLDVIVPDVFFTGGMEPANRVTRQYNWSPLITEFKTDFPEFNFRFKVMDRSAFEQAVQSAGENPPFDIAFVDNQNERGPLEARTAVEEMMGQSRFLQNGWWLVFRRSMHVEAAEAFLLWLSQSPTWRPWQVATEPMQQSDSGAVQSLATTVVTAYAQGDMPSLSPVLDEQASGFYRLPRNESVTKVQPLLTFGNSNLAFVLMSAICRRETAFGLSHFAMALRKVGEQWKVLLFLEGSVPSLEGILKAFDRLRLQDAQQQVVPVAQLGEPVDHARISRLPRRQLTWVPVNAPISTYLIESQYAQPQRTDPNWSLSQVWLVRPRPDEQALQQPIPFGVGQQPHRWRVWAISSGGGVSISAWRTIDFTN